MKYLRPEDIDAGMIERFIEAWKKTGLASLETSVPIALIAALCDRRKGERRVTYVERQPAASPERSWGGGIEGLFQTELPQFHKRAGETVNRHHFRRLKPARVWRESHFREGDTGMPFYHRRASDRTGIAVAAGESSTAFEDKPKPTPTVPEVSDAMAKEGLRVLQFDDLGDYPRYSPNIRSAFKAMYLKHLEEQGWDGLGPGGA
jgi:hypothetical protein